MRLWSIVLVITGTEREPFPSHTPSVSLSPRWCVSVLGRPQQSMAGRGLNGRHLFLTVLEARWPGQGVLGRLVPPEASVRGLWTAVFSPRPHTASYLCPDFIVS